MNNKGDGIVSAEEEVQPTISEHISFAVGHLTDLICKHSYVFSNVTMMVSFRHHVETSFSYQLFHDVAFDFFSGLEHCLPQLVDIRIPHLCQHPVDHTKSAQEYASHQSVCGDLCGIFTDCSVFILHGFNGERTTIVCRYQGNQFSANWIHSVSSVSLWAIAVENIIHSDILVNSATNEV